MEQLQHFSHEHPLSLVQLEPNRNENFVNEDEDEDKDKDIDNFLVEERHVAKCKMCKEDVYKFHLCYYSCKDCDYSLHKLCAELPKTQQNHPLHPGHNLTLSEWSQYNDPDINWKPELDSEWRCSICRINKKSFYNYHCFTCKFTMDIICATVSEQKMDHPSHHHQLQRSSRWMISYCNACGDKHQGTFYNCTTCSGFNIHLDCALLPSKLLIQQSTNMSFSHTHLLTLTYSFPFVELKAKFFCPCRVCDGSLRMYDWHYRCDKCRYYAHVECATSMRDAFMSTLLPAGFGETHKNFKNEEHPNLIQCPFPDESVNLLMSLFIKKGESTAKGKIDGEIFGHKHPLILFDTYTSLLSA